MAGGSAHRRMNQEEMPGEKREGGKRGTAVGKPELPGTAGTSGVAGRHKAPGGRTRLEKSGVRELRLSSGGGARRGATRTVDFPVGVFPYDE